MSALMCPYSVSIADPRPFLLEDQFTAVGQLCVVFDEDWDKTIELITAMDVNNTLVITETEAGPFLTVSIPSKRGVN